MDDAFLMSRFQGLTDLLGDVEGFLDWQRTSRNPFCQSFALDQFHDEKPRVVRFLKIVDRGDVGVVQRCKDLRFALESTYAISISGKHSGRILMATLRPSLVSLARYTSPIPPAPIRPT